MSESKLGEQCEHGSLKRQCRVCELEHELLVASDRLAAYDALFAGVPAGERGHVVQLFADGQKQLKALVNFKPTVEQVNALPEGVRRYVCDLETRCDPAGDVAALTLTRDQNVMLQERLEKVRKIADRMERNLAAVEAERTDGQRQLKELQAENAKLHERCHQFKQKAASVAATSVAVQKSLLAVEAENAKLRECVKAADMIRPCLDYDCHDENGAPVGRFWSEYDAARKGMKV